MISEINQGTQPKTEDPFRWTKEAEKQGWINNLVEMTDKQLKQKLIAEG